MVEDRAIPEGAQVRIKLGTEVEVATVVKSGPSSVRVRLKDGNVVKRKIARDVLEVLDVGEGREEAPGDTAAGSEVGDEDRPLPEV